MNQLSKPVILIAIMGWLSFFSFLGCGRKSKAEVFTKAHGPFTIEARTVSSRYFNMNYGRMSTHTRTDYFIWHRGEPIHFPDALQTNTGFNNLWKVYILSDAPQPTLIAGSQSLYLIVEEAGAPKLIPLDEQASSFAGLQWLDSENGQPDQLWEVYMSEDRDSFFTLTGGKHLLINGTTVLHVPDLTIYPFNREKRWVDGYSIANVTGAIALSPDQKQIVFVGNKNDEHDYMKYLYALVVFDFTTGDSYSVPFDQTDTRTRDPYRVSREWVSTFFEWTPEASGGYRLQQRHLDQLPYWQGWFSDGGKYYNVQPVSEALLPVFAQFVLDQWNLPDEDFQMETVVEFQYIHIQKGQLKFTVGYRAVAKELHFSKYLYEPDTEEYQKLVNQIGAAFDADLARGKYQSYFTSY